MMRKGVQGMNDKEKSLQKVEDNIENERKVG